MTGRMADVSELVDRREYGRAADILRAEIERSPSNAAARLLLADVLVLEGRPSDATDILEKLADEYARTGAPAKAIAVLKKLEQLDPSRHRLSEGRIAQLSKERDQETAQQEWLKRSGQKRGRDSSDSLPTVSPLEIAPIDVDFDLGRERHPAKPAPGQGTLAFELAGEKAAEGARPEIGVSPLFSDLSTDELLAVIRGLRLVSAEPGDIVVTEGAPGTSLFVLTTGTVKAFVHASDGNSRLVRKMTDGAFFGEVSILTGKPRSATIVAATSCELLELDRPTLEAIAQDHPRVLEVLQTFCAMRLGSASEAEARKGKG